MEILLRTRLEKANTLFQLQERCLLTKNMQDLSAASEPGQLTQSSRLAKIKNAETERPTRIPE